MLEKYFDSPMKLAAAVATKLRTDAVKQSAPGEFLPCPTSRIHTDLNSS